MGKKRSAPHTRERFGFAGKERREQLELTQEDLAEKAKIHRTYLSDIERGSRDLSLLNIEKVAAAPFPSISPLFPRRCGAVPVHLRAVPAGRAILIVKRRPPPGQGAEPRPGPAVRSGPHVHGRE